MSQLAAFRQTKARNHFQASLAAHALRIGKIRAPSGQSRAGFFKAAGNGKARLEIAVARVEAAGGITRADARRLRKRWERIKSSTEGLVRAAEKGRFARKSSA